MIKLVVTAGTLTITTRGFLKYVFRTWAELIHPRFAMLSGDTIKFTYLVDCLSVGLLWCFPRVRRFTKLGVSFFCLTTWSFAFIFPRLLAKFLEGMDFDWIGRLEGCHRKGPLVANSIFCTPDGQIITTLNSFPPCVSQVPSC